MDDLGKVVQYRQELFAQKTPYLQWLKKQEAECCGHDTGRQIYTLPFSSCMDGVGGCGQFSDNEIYLFMKREGSLPDYAKAEFAAAFSGNANVVFAYADEDYRGSLEVLYGIREGFLDEGNYRGAPWFKPDYSPDTLASFFYPGSVFAIRGRTVREVLRIYGGSISIYELVYRIFMDELDRRQRGDAEGIVHIPRVLYTNDRLADSERMDSSDRIKELYRAKNVVQSDKQDKVSIVIPSKDNAQVLQKCLETLTRHTDYDCYEIVVVDNGSNSEQRMCITDIIDALKKENTDLAIQYLYRKSEFNFSAMCNAGAQRADGSYLLFLNDDIEVMDTAEGRGWLSKMVEYARKSHVGAVGAKLYYPGCPGQNDCYKIQHTGITNMGIGPAHKLGGMVDEGCLYHGHNTHNYDMLAVTAACMLVRKSVFDEVGGFDESFPVAYNDVEFCFRLYQQGYFNVQVNEAALIHHESLSRGQDTSPEKRSRLAAEKKKLYQKYPLFHAKDPFYSPNLVQWKRDVEYNTGYLYGFDRPTAPILLENNGEYGKRKHTILKRHDFRNLLNAMYSPAGKIYDRLTGYHDLMLCIDSVGYEDGITGDNIVIEGWCAVRDRDNADIPRKLWLIYQTRTWDFGNVYEFDIAPKLREDVAKLLERNDNGRNDRKRTRNAALSGIYVVIEQSVLKPGTYSIGVLCRNKLICSPNQSVVVPKDADRDTERKV